MSFELKRKEAVPDGIRRVIGERIDKAMAALNGDARKTPDDEAVHEARKRFKQIRGALRLARKELGNKKFGRENRTFRDAGRPLSEVRDAKVMVDTLKDLAKRYKGRLSPAAFKQFQVALNKRRIKIRESVLNRNHAARSIISHVRKAEGRTSDWSMTHNGWKAIAPGLRKTYRAARDAMLEAVREDSDEALHEWRKRSKDLRYAIELLSRAWPEALESFSESISHLTDLLGQDHDLAVLQEIVDHDFADTGSDEAQKSLLKALVSQRRSELLDEARELGRKIYAESNQQFLDRVHGYWRAWR